MIQLPTQPDEPRNVHPSADWNDWRAIWRERWKALLATLSTIGREARYWLRLLRLRWMYQRRHVLWQGVFLLLAGMLFVLWWRCGRTIGTRWDAIYGPGPDQVDAYILAHSDALTNTAAEQLAAQFAAHSPGLLIWTWAWVLVTLLGVVALDLYWLLKCLWQIRYPHRGAFASVSQLMRVAGGILVTIVAGLAIQLEIPWQLSAVPWGGERMVAAIWWAGLSMLFFVVAAFLLCMINLDDFGNDPRGSEGSVDVPLDVG